MFEYVLHFEFFGKKMKTTVWADSEEHAQELVADRLNFHSVRPTGKTDGVILVLIIDEDGCC